MNTTISDTAARSHSDAERSPEGLSRSSVRELVIALAALEDRLRTSPAPLDRAEVARELRGVVRELRRRRDQMRALSLQGK